MKPSHLQRQYAISFAAVAGCNSTARSCTSPYGTPDSPQITFIDGDLTMRGDESGAGILLVTGKLTFSGTPTYKGIILVIGQCECKCYAGVPTYNINGGGNSEFYGDPDAISWKVAALMPLDVISFRPMH